MKIDTRPGRPVIHVGSGRKDGLTIAQEGERFVRVTREEAALIAHALLLYLDGTEKARVKERADRW